MKTKTVLRFATLAFAGALLNGCGTSSTGGTAASLSSALTDLSKIPDASSMVQANGRHFSSTEQLRPLRAGLGLLNTSFDLRDVVGTPPLVKDISESNFDGYFWNGLVAQINGYSTPAWSTIVADNSPSGLALKQTLTSQFWGQDTTTPGPGGNGACNMAMSTVEALARMMEGAGTMCYMKNMTTVTSAGVTVTGSTQADAFKQEAEDKLVKVHVTNMPSGPRNRPGTDMDVFFTIKGSNTVTSDKYAYSMYMCLAGNVTDKESLEVNKSTGVITMTNERDGEGDKGYNQVTAYLTTDSAGNVAFDSSKVRTALSNHSGSWGTYKGQISISGDNLITSRRLFSNPGWGSNKDFSISSFSGSNVNTLRFREAAYKGISTPLVGDSHSFSGVTEFQTDHFVSVASSAISTSTDFTSTDVATDTFYADGSVPTMDTTGLNCSATPAVTVTMDFADPNVAAIGLVCEGNKMNDFNYGLCYGTSVNSAMSRLWSIMGPPPSP